MQRKSGRRGSGPADDKRRSLSNVGGATRRFGDVELSGMLAAAMNPDPRDEGRALTQGFHAWPGRMHPHTARGLIAALGDAPGEVFDPFMGAGTVAVEALLAGRGFVGADVNPIGAEVAWARTRRWPQARLAGLVDDARACVHRARDLRKGARAPSDFFRSEREWYDPPALAEVWSLSQAIMTLRDRELSRLLAACLSSILVKASRQASDSVARPDRDHRWVAPRRVERWFVARVGEHAENLAAFAAALPEGGMGPYFAIEDARDTTWVADGDFELAGVVSSPPYPGTYDYVNHHRRRYAALGLQPHLAETAEMGSRRAQQALGREESTIRYIEDVTGALRAWARVMRPHSMALLVIGDGQDADGPIEVVPLIERAVERADWSVQALVSQPRVYRGARPVGYADGASPEKFEHAIAVLSGA